MTDEELAFYRNQLLEKLKTLSGDFHKLESDVMRSKKDSATLDISKFADLGSDNYEIEFDMEMLQSEGEEIRCILDALKRVDEGTYGKCTSCGKKIRKPRLKAIPYATLCVKCKTKEEEKGGAFDY